MECKARAQQIKLIVFDVDGVLTNGQLIFGHNGEAFKMFHTQDGLGISAAHQAGLKTAIITGRISEIVRLRAEELHIADIYQGQKNKVIALIELLDKHSVTLNQVAYVGDDLNDLPVLVKVGFACAVANAVVEVKRQAHFITQKRGGEGGVREIIEFILQAQGKWENIVNSYVADQFVVTRQ